MRTALFVLLLTFSSVTWSTETSSTWSLNYLAESANFLTAAADFSTPKNAEKDFCGVPAKQALRMINNLHALIDAKIASLNPAQVAQVSERAPTCEKTCTCGTLQAALESKDPQNAEKIQMLTTKGQALTGPARVTCARKFKNFCSSFLLKSLRNGTSHKK